ncbi:hypothetical protein ACHWQZ_G000687 [Mnemiopsis leidyi]
MNLIRPCRLLIIIASVLPQFSGKEDSSRYTLWENPNGEACDDKKGFELDCPLFAQAGHCVGGMFRKHVQETCKRSCDSCPSDEAQAACFERYTALDGKFRTYRYTDEKTCIDECLKLEKSSCAAITIRGPERGEESSNIYCFMFEPGYTRSEYKQMWFTAGRTCMETRRTRRIVSQRGYVIDIKLSPAKRRKCIKEGRVSYTNITSVSEPHTTKDECAERCFNNTNCVAINITPVHPSRLFQYCQLVLQLDNKANYVEEPQPIWITAERSCLYHKECHDLGNTWTNAITNQTFPVKTGHVITLHCRKRDGVLHGSKEITCMRGTKFSYSTYPWCGREDSYTSPRQIFSWLDFKTMNLSTVFNVTAVPRKPDQAFKKPGRILTVDGRIVVIQRRSLFAEKVDQTYMSDVFEELILHLVCGIFCFSALMVILIIVVQRHGKGKHVVIDGRWEWRAETNYGF